RIGQAAVQNGRAPGVQFERGGFELAGHRPVLVRAFNVLRQYPEDAVTEAWTAMRQALAPGGLVIDGTCDELGRRCCWVLLDTTSVVSLTLACDPFAIERPSDLAERLPKVLIHHNVAGQPIHTLLQAADRAWASVAGHGVFGPRVRWRAMMELLVAEGFPVKSPRRSLRDGILTVPWSAVAPD
ncbi:MAG: class I SAM-dependent methyltransferase, partial [Dietzia sp.]|nr:class I SAM-dependent methyltransferase [Dietzia sp.]